LGIHQRRHPDGPLAYFIEFLGLTGLWSRWQEICPLTYASPNAPSLADVLGTWMLSEESMTWVPAFAGMMNYSASP